MNTREPSLSFDVAGLEGYLTGVIAGFRGPIRVQQFVHGQSNPTYLLETASQRYVLRRKPPGVLLPSAHAVDREFRVMRALLPTDVPVPRTLCYCDDDSVIGTAFYVMEYIEGRIFQDVSLETLQPAERTAIYSELNRVIAALHRVEPANIGLGDFGKHGGYVARQVARWTKQYRASELQRIDALERLMEWLPQHIPAEQPSRITHGDYRLDNVIFHPREPRILAVIDWELATLGDPLADFVYHCMPWRLPPGLGGSLLGSFYPPAPGAELDAAGLPYDGVSSADPDRRRDPRGARGLHRVSGGEEVGGDSVRCERPGEGEGRRHGFDRLSGGVGGSRLLRHEERRARHQYPRPDPEPERPLLPLRFRPLVRVRFR